MAAVPIFPLLLLVALVCSVPGAAARAHAVLLETVPADRSVVTAPAAIELRFGEPVTPVSLRVLDASGRTVAGPGAAVAVGAVVRQAVPAGLAEGLYLVSYRIVSADSHPLSGSFQFAVGQRPAAWAASETETPTVGAGGPVGAIRALHLISLAVAVGGVAFLLLVQPGAPLGGRLRRGLVAAAAVSGISAVLAVGLQGALLAGAAPTDLLDPALWRLGASTTRGTAAGLTALASVALLVGLLVALGPVARALLGGGAAAAVIGFALSGHAVIAGPRWVTVPAILAHAGVALFWIGSLLPLAARLRDGPDAAAGPLARFSTIAVAAVPVLLFAGLLLAVLQIERPAALVETRYGSLFLVKLALVAALLGLAAYNRLRLLPDLVAVRHGTARRFRRTVAAELSIGAAVLAVTAFLSQTPPPRSMPPATGSAESHVVAVTAGRRLAVVEVAPARSGPDNRVTVHLIGDDGRPLDVLEAVLVVANRPAGIEPMERPLDRRGSGLYSHTGPLFPLPGRWTLRVDVLVDDFHKTRFQTSMTVE